MTLPTGALTKPTIVNGKWINLPPPPQDAEWLKRHASDNAKGQDR